MKELHWQGLLVLKFTKFKKYERKEVFVVFRGSFVLIINDAE